MRLGVKNAIWQVGHSESPINTLWKPNGLYTYPPGRWYQNSFDIHQIIYPDLIQEKAKEHGMICIRLACNFVYTHLLCTRWGRIDQMGGLCAKFRKTAKPILRANLDDCANGIWTIRWRVMLGAFYYQSSHFVTLGIYVQLGFSRSVMWRDVHYTQRPINRFLLCWVLCKSRVVSSCNWLLQSFLKVYSNAMIISMIGFNFYWTNWHWARTCIIQIIPSRG